MSQLTMCAGEMTTKAIARADGAVIVTVGNDVDRWWRTELYNKRDYKNGADTLSEQSGLSSRKIMLAILLAAEGAKV